MFRLAILTLLLTACGGSDKSSEAPTDGTPDPAQVAPPPASTPQSLAMTSAELPVCGADNNQQLVYLTDTKQFKTCQAGAWAVIDIKGATGATGATGAAGADGTGLAVSFSWMCPGSTGDLDPDASFESKGRNAFVTQFTNGVTTINCMDRWYVPGIPFYDTSSFALTFAASSQASEDGEFPCNGSYAGITFSVDAVAAEWEGFATGGLTEVVSCTQAYP